MTNCKNCNLVRKSVSVSSDMLITLNNTAVGGMQNFCWCMCVYCTVQPTKAVTMTINGNAVPLWDIYGRPVYSNQLQARKVYRSCFVEEGTPHVTVCNIYPTEKCARVSVTPAPSPTPATRAAAKTKE